MERKGLNEELTRGMEKSVDEAGRFRKALLEAVDYGLLALGERVRQVIYHHIERNYQVKREEIPEKIDAFRKALEGIFGAAAKVVEKLIAKNLYSILGLNFTENQNWTLVEYVNDAKKARGEV